MMVELFWLISSSFEASKVSVWLLFDLGDVLLLVSRSCGDIVSWFLFLLVCGVLIWLGSHNSDPSWLCSGWVGSWSLNLTFFLGCSDGCSAILFWLVCLVAGWPGLALWLPLDTMIEVKNGLLKSSLLFCKFTLPSCWKFSSLVRWICRIANLILTDHF